MRLDRPRTSLPCLRPLARGLLLALAVVPAAAVFAGDLDNQHADVGPGDPIEA